MPSLQTLTLAMAAKTAAAKQFLTTAKPAAKFAALTASTKRRHNVVGVGVGPKVKNGKLTKTFAVRFYVEHKIGLKAIPQADRIPSSINGVPTDVIESGRFFAQVPLAQQRLRPAKGGNSVGFQGVGFVMAGTFGCLVTDGTSRLILSNNHVLADENSLPIGSPIFQPGLLDGGSATTDRIARLKKFVTIKKLPKTNHVDAAIAKLDRPALASPQILTPINALTSPAPIKAAVGMKVQKHGRTTGFTTGAVVDISADINVGYDFGTARFVDQIVVIGDNNKPFSASGDSGSLIVTRPGKRATALLFAGSTSHTIANPIQEVLSALGVTLVV
jgi:hypothetical protein